MEATDAGKIKRKVPKVEAPDIKKVKGILDLEQDSRTAPMKRKEVGNRLDSEDGEEDEEIGGDEDGKMTRGRVVTHGYYLVEGKMNHGMEDYLVAKNMRVDGHHLGLYAIFDGHSGREAAEYLKDNLFDNILLEPDFWSDPVSAVKRAFRTTDDEILTRVANHRGGSAAVTAILDNGKRLVVGNVGDSRAVICKNGKAVAITVDHEPEKEKELVESKGGLVSQKPGNVPRVDGQLSMTRAFGDGRLKEHITAEPDVFVEAIDDEAEFLILASDGLWKVMSNQDASDCAKGLTNAREVAKKLIREAVERGSRDDVSCVVVLFQ